MYSRTSRPTTAGHSWTPYTTSRKHRRRLKQTSLTRSLESRLRVATALLAPEFVSTPSWSDHRPSQPRWKCWVWYNRQMQCGLFDFIYYNISIYQLFVRTIVSRNSQYVVVTHTSPESMLRSSLACELRRIHETMLLVDTTGATGVLARTDVVKVVERQTHKHSTKGRCRTAD